MSDVKKLTIAALLSSFVCVATMIIQVPNGIGGYFNLGDCIVLLCGWLLGPVYGAFSAGIGSMLADIFSSYVIYAPATGIIKAMMAVVSFYIARRGQGRCSLIFSGVCAEFVMIFGYFVYEWVLYGIGGALPSILPNLMQGIVGIVCAFFLKEIIDRKGLWKN